ncbi:rRNA biogenesis protein rrp36-like [Cynara cardunculus var. scolymus]|uniref:rRNA biogenesis protein rrp36-like n=1 Tax=Cynara cardunculus var. scolymus TaxID=59895 RepID=UPI000D623A63|nr:rRNA biogenesis protein rrp36-like [Cynara cardunculus var. scolymus]
MGSNNVHAARVEAHDNAHPVTSAADVGNLDEDSDDDEDDETPDLPDTSKDLDDDDDEDDDDDDFTIQYQRLVDATTGVALRESVSQGEQGVKEASQEKHQDPKSKGKGVVEEWNLKAEEGLELQRKQTEDSLKLAKSLAAKVLPKRKSKKKVTVVQAQAKLLSLAEVEHEKNLKLAERDKHWSEASINKRISPHLIKSVSISE